MGSPSSHKENFRSRWFYQEALPNILEASDFKCPKTTPGPAKEQTLPDKADISWALKPNQGFKRKENKMASTFQSLLIESNNIERILHGD